MQLKGNCNSNNNENSNINHVARNNRNKNNKILQSKLIKVNLTGRIIAALIAEMIIANAATT